MPIDFKISNLNPRPPQFEPTIPPITAKTPLIVAAPAATIIPEPKDPPPVTPIPAFTDIMEGRADDFINKDEIMAQLLAVKEKRKKKEVKKPQKREILVKKVPKEARNYDFEKVLAPIENPLHDSKNKEQPEFKQWDGRTNPLKDMDWIFQNIANDVTPDSAPSPGAYAYIQRLQESDELSDEFYKLYINRRLPSRNVIEEFEAKLNDDGVDLRDFIEKRIKAITDKINKVVA